MYWSRSLGSTRARDILWFLDQYPRKRLSCLRGQSKRVTSALDASNVHLLMRILRMIFHMVIHATWLSICFPLAFFAALAHPRGGGVWVGRRIWGPFLLWAVRARLVVHGAHNADPSRPTVYVANHQSAMDIPVAFVALPVNFRFVAKKSLRHIPLLGWYLVSGGHLLVDRGSSASAMATLEKAAAQIRRGTSILMFAEGTRSPDGRLLPFKKGSFVLALRAGAAICPVTIEGTAQIMPKNSWKIASGQEIHVKIGAPIDARQYGPHERDRLMRDVRRIMVAQSLELGGRGGDVDEAPAPSAPRSPGALHAHRKVET
jgi:1-acyl-sn-glycerol-3-phosphate acyltransferase